MSHRATQRRSLARPEASVEPALRKPEPITKPMRSSDPVTVPTIPSKPSSNFYSNYLSKSLDSTLGRGIRAPQKPISRKDPLLKPKPVVSVSSKEEDERVEKSQDKAICLKSVEQVVRKKKSDHLVVGGGGGGAQRDSVPSLPLVPSGGGSGRRRSLGGSQAELADVFASNGVKVVAVDMPPFMQIHAVEFARKVRDSMEKFTSRTLASTLKKEFDGIYGPAWHCIVGTSFGSFVTHSVGGFLYFSMDQKLYILLFKTTVQRAD